MDVKLPMEAKWVDGKKVAQLYHDGSDGKSYSIVYINLDLNVGEDEMLILNQSLLKGWNNCSC